MQVRTIVRVAVCFVAVTSASMMTQAADVAPWQQNLYLGMGGYWHSRIVVEITNPRKPVLEGWPVTVKVGHGANQLNIGGARVASLRVCDVNGAEMLYDVSANADGKVADGSDFTFPVECAPDRTVTYYVYFNNPQAWAVPDALNAAVGVVNPSFESGDTTPDGWKLDAGDGQHKIEWSPVSPRTGSRCIKTTVVAGAEPSWIAARQAGMAVVPGKTYVLHGWVRAQDVKGRVGFYFRIQSKTDTFGIGGNETAYERTYTWRQVVKKLVAPNDATTALFGTVLYGTGTAWFDDVTIESNAGADVGIHVGTPEKMVLSEPAETSAWFSDHSAADHIWTARCPIQLMNMSDTPLPHVLVSVDDRRLSERMHDQLSDGSIRIVDPRDGNHPVPVIAMGDHIAFFATVPGRSIVSYYLYGSSDAGIPPPPRADLDNLVGTHGNLARNPGFEDGGVLPDQWQASAEGSKETVEASRSTEARVGKYCVKMVVPPGAPSAWRGWRQTVNVEANADYLYAAYVKTANVNDGEVTLHAHCVSADGKWTGFSAPTMLSGTTDWTLITSVLHTAPDTSKVELHLTTQTHGTVWFDAVVFIRVLSGTVGEVEFHEPRTAPDVAVWAVNPLVKVFQNDVPPATAVPPHMAAARNEYESGQVAVRSRLALRNVTVRIGSLTGAHGAHIDSVEVRRVGYVPIDHAGDYFPSNEPLWHLRFPRSESSGDGWAGMWPDPLLPESPTDIAANTTQPFWITAHVPPGTPAGDYNGRIVVESDGRPVQTLPLRFTVWNFVLPDHPSLKAEFDFLIPREFLRTSGKTIDQLRRQWYAFYAEHDICPGVIEPPPVFHYSNGAYTMDTKDFDAAASYCLNELGMRMFYTPACFYCFGWANPPKKFLGFKPFTPEYKHAYQTCLKLFYQHLRAKGWDDKAVLYISDEPHFDQKSIVEQMTRLCDMIHEAVPDAKIYSSTWRYEPAWNKALDIWGIGSYGCFPVEEMKARLSAGSQLWYTTDGQMCIDTPYCAIERLLPYYCWKYGVTGYEFWGLTAWTRNPFQYGWHTYINPSPNPGVVNTHRNPNGDGYLAYPGLLIGVDGPVSSIRLEQVREGIEDYAYFQMLKKKAGAHPTPAQKAALDAIDSLVTIPNAGGRRSSLILKDPDAVYRVRERVAAAVTSN